MSTKKLSRLWNVSARKMMEEAKNKTMQTAWMLHEWVKENEKLMKKMLEDDLEKEQ